jgi:hypothetical protein
MPIYAIFITKVELSTIGNCTIFRHNKHFNFYRSLNIWRVILGNFLNYKTTEPWQKPRTYWIRKVYHFKYRLVTLHWSNDQQIFILSDGETIGVAAVAAPLIPAKLMSVVGMKNDHSVATLVISRSSDPMNALRLKHGGYRPKSNKKKKRNHRLVGRWQGQIIYRRIAQ